MQNKNAFTLIELLVSMSIFVIVITGFLGLFASAMKHQQQSADKVHLLNNVSYASEYMARALRMAQKDLDGGCADAKTNYKQSSLSEIQFLRFEPDNNNLICWRFFLDGATAQIKVQKSSDETAANLGLEQAITPFQNLEITDLEFKVVNNVQDDKLQPAVTFIIGAKTKVADAPTVHTQTTVSQRALDITY